MCQFGNTLTLGFIICNKKHKEFYDKIVKYYLENRDNIVKLQETYGVGTDQPILNFFVQSEKNYNEIFTVRMEYARFD